MPSFQGCAAAQQFPLSFAHSQDGLQRTSPYFSACVLRVGVESVCLVGVGAIVSRETIGRAREKAFGWRVRARGSVRMAGRCNAGACGWRMQTSGSAQSARTKMRERADGRENSDVRMQGPRGRVRKQRAFAGRFRGCRDDGGFETPGRWGFGVLARTCEAVCDPMEPPRAFLRR